METSTDSLPVGPRWIPCYIGAVVDGITETEFAHKPAMDIAILTARQADLAATFNYSSQAHNNHFFFEALVHRILPVHISI